MADAFGNLGQAAAPSATETIDARQWLVPGWYWAFLDPAEAGSVWSAFTKKNPAVRTRKTVGTTEKGSWVLFEVQGTQPVIWTLPGYPSKALKGANTEYSDVIDQSQNEPATANALSDFLANIGKELGTAGHVLLWGGVAILLWQVFQKTGGTSSSPKRIAVEPDYEEHHVVTRSPRSGQRTRQGTLISNR